jgi:FG-GAP repeat
MKRTNWIRISCIAAIIAACSLVGVASAGTWPETKKLIASDNVAGDDFGKSVSISGTTAIVGAPGERDSEGYGTGAAYVYEYNEDSSSWSEVAKLFSVDRRSFQKFGSAVAISGTTAIVGDKTDYENGSWAGAAYVFENDGSAWSEVAKLTASDAQANEFFATSISISGNTAILGTAPAGMGSGSAYIFENDGSGWAEVAKLTPSDDAHGVPGTWFGRSVSISGNTAVIGDITAQKDGSSTGAAYVFEKDGSGWSQVAALRAADGVEFDEFGNSVSISGDTIIVGADSVDGSPVNNIGAAYVFENNGSGWAQVAKLMASDAKAGDYFGQSVSISGDAAVVGATDENWDYAGAAYVFEDNGSGWAQTAKLTGTDGQDDAHFGVSVSISGTAVVVGDDFDDPNGDHSGSAYIFGTASAYTEPVIPPSTEPVPEPMSMIFFGTGVVGVLGFVSRRKMLKVS